VMAFPNRRKKEGCKDYFRKNGSLCLQDVNIALCLRLRLRYCKVSDSNSFKVC